MKKKFLIIGKSIFFMVFIVIFYHRISDYSISYLKFSLLDFINENKLESFYYILGALEFILAIGIFFSFNRVVRSIIDLALIIYIIFHTGLYFMLSNAGECIECNYSVHIANESLRVSIIILGLLSILYIFFLRQNFKKNRFF